MRCEEYSASYKGVSRRRKKLLRVVNSGGGLGECRWVYFQVGKGPCPRLIWFLITLWRSGYRNRRGAGPCLCFFFFIIPLGESGTKTGGGGAPLPYLKLKIDQYSKEARYFNP